MNAFTIGGTIRTTFTVAEELAKRGRKVEIVSVYRIRTGPPALPVPPGVRIRTLTDLRAPTLERLNAAHGPVARLRLWLLSRPSRLISSSDYKHHNFNLLTDVNLLRYLASARDGILIGTRPGINLAIAALAPDSVVRIGQDHVNLPSYRPWLRAQMRRFYPRLDMVTTLTPETARGYQKLLRQRVPVECFPNPVPDLGGHRADPDAKVVIAAGRLTRQKGFDRLLPAWAEVAEKHRGWELRIFGDGRERENLERQIDELGIGDSVRLEGFTKQLYEEFSHASLYVMSSRQEGFPMVLLEAMGVGLPAVSVDCPTGPREIISEGVDGFVVPERDTPALASAISDLMADAAKRRRFGAAAFESAARYDAGALAERWEQVFAELATKTADRRGTTARRLLKLIGAMLVARGRQLVRG